MTNQTRKSQKIEMDIEISDNNNEAQTIGKEKEEISLRKSSRYFYAFFCPGTMTTHAESINSDLQTFTTHNNIEHRTEPVSH